MSPPPLPLDSRDEGHLDALKICYYVSAGLGGLGLLFLFCHFLVFSTFFGSEALTKSAKLEDVALLEMMMTGMGWFYGVMALLIIVIIILDILCARAIAERRNMVLIQVVAGITCLSIPLGTTLGVFTFVILARPSVRNFFERERA